MDKNERYFFWPIKNTNVDVVQLIIMSRELPILFFGTTTFNKKFPQIDDVSVTIIEIISDLFNPQEIPTRYSKITKVPARHPCSNPKCNDGGVDINQIIEEMVANKEKIYEKKSMCRGLETSPKGRIKYGRCNHDFKVNVKIIYKENDLQKN